MRLRRRDERDALLRDIYRLIDEAKVDVGAGERPAVLACLRQLAAKAAALGGRAWDEVASPRASGGRRVELLERCLPDDPGRPE